MYQLNDFPQKVFQHHSSYTYSNRVYYLSIPVPILLWARCDTQMEFHGLPGLTSWHPVCLSLGDPLHLALCACHCHHPTLPEADGSWQQRTWDRVPTGAHCPEGGPRQVRAFPHISQARQQLLALRTHTSSFWHCVFLPWRWLMNPRPLLPICIYCTHKPDS